VVVEATLTLCLKHFYLCAPSALLHASQAERSTRGRVIPKEGNTLVNHFRFLDLLREAVLCRWIRVVQQKGCLVSGTQLLLRTHLHETHAVLGVQGLSSLGQDLLRNRRCIAAVRPHSRIELSVVIASRCIEKLSVVPVSDVVELAPSLLEVRHPAELCSQVPFF
jgi:hypothetical protein